MLHRGLHVWSLKRYCVTVMDCWTPFRLFWTERGARRWMNEFYPGAYLYKWADGRWVEIGRK